MDTERAELLESISQGGSLRRRGGEEREWRRWREGGEGKRWREEEGGSEGREEGSRGTSQRVVGLSCSLRSVSIHPAVETIPR